MSVFSYDDLPLHYLQRGSGQPVLLIHGLGSSGADWALQVRALERRFRTIVPDLPGSGLSAAPRGEYSIKDFAKTLWALLDHLHVSSVSIVGFSLGGAVALEMALQRPSCVARLALINSLATYRINHWRKWMEARIPAALVPLLGMRRAARFAAARLFPQPWQKAIRERAAAVVAAVPASSYLGMGLALQRWEATDRLHRLTSRTLLIAAEHDYTPLAEKQELATQLRASLVVVRGSRHGTPFDASLATNLSLKAFLSDKPLPPRRRWACDAPTYSQALSLVGSIAEEHALSAANLKSLGAYGGSSPKSMEKPALKISVRTTLPPQPVAQ